MKEINRIVGIKTSVHRWETNKTRKMSNDEKIHELIKMVKDTLCELKEMKKEQRSYYEDMTTIRQDRKDFFEYQKNCIEEIKMIKEENKIFKGKTRTTGNKIEEGEHYRKQVGKN